MIDDGTLRDALKTLDTPVLVRLRDAMYEVNGGQEMDLIIQVLRDRLVKPAPWERFQHGGGFTYVKFCNQATGPDDPEHQMADLDIPNGPCDPGCTCGRRLFDYVRSRRMMFAARRDNSNPHVWPVIPIQVGGQTVPHFAICGAARAPFDPGHAPPSHDYEEHCICGRFFKDSLCTLTEYYDFDGSHVDCTGGPDGCQLGCGLVPSDLSCGHAFQGKLFPLY